MIYITTYDLFQSWFLSRIPNNPPITIAISSNVSLMGQQMDRIFKAVEAVEQVDKQIYGNSKWQERTVKAIAKIVIISISLPIKDNNNNKRNRYSWTLNGNGTTPATWVRFFQENHPQAFSTATTDSSARPVQMQQKLKLTNFRQCLDIFQAGEQQAVPSTTAHDRTRVRVP